MDTQPGEEPTDLIAAVARGDRQALERLYDRYAPIVHSVGLRILGIRADADDVVQEVFLQVWRRAETYRPDRGSPECWILTIARNRALAKMRAANTMKKGLETLRLRPRPTGVESASGPVVRAESATAVRTALAGLPDEQRRALELAYFEGLTQSEIAARLGEPLGTVKTRIRLGMERLRRLVGEGEMPEGLP
ncbi:ECF RNA polymerase sigma factor RpoE (plasmid) [Aquisphaera giovannonii]|uniref:ECF RNA polymerase sigma factor RpoE n=1 Tax=Aquisphaera giovannonii TaxID=406548 RepID=A0A5B9WF40_9BACT|nr:sigma-70 family RNA polymerase sigma factor [Aquisphaera giovannonii]QEH39248.1 ECF RNA polymerase sigma factor RpoE [Aquisphaera giovannonii]